MKNILALTVIALFIASCSNRKATNISVDDLILTGNKTEIKQRLSKLQSQQETILEEIKKLESVTDTPSNSGKSPLVTTFIAEESIFNHYLEVQGNVVTKQNIILFAEYGGTLTKVNVTKGSQVKKGQVLARIDDGGLKQQIAQMEVQVSLAKTTFERQKRLWEQKIGSEIQYLQAETTYKAQENAIKQLEAQLEKTIVRAPFSGVIDDVFSEQGSVVAPGQSQLLRIVNLNNMYIEAEVPENHLLNVTKGKSVQAYFPVIGETVETEVRQVSNFINPNNRSFKIEVGVPNQNRTIKPNLTSKVKINDYTNEKAILIPQSIISENAQSQQYIYVVSNKDVNNLAEAKRVIIETGLTQGDFIEVLSGIQKDSEIIEEGARNVKAGQKVKILTQ